MMVIVEAFLLLLVHPAWSLYASPLAGLSVSPEYGFVMVLASQGKQQRMCPIAISKRDTERVVSAEGHTILQLIAGIDAATAVLPPDALQRAFQDDSVRLTDVVIQRRRTLNKPELKLRRVEEEEDRDPDQCDLASAARRAPDLVKAVGSLGLPLFESDAIKLLQKYSIQGELTREAFSDVVKDLKDETCVTDTVIETRLYAEDGRNVETTAFTAFALAFRYAVPLTVDPILYELSDLAFDAPDATDRFPLFQNIRDLQDQGRRLEQHSRSLFAQATQRVQSALNDKDSSGNRRLYDDDDPPLNNNDPPGESSPGTFQPRDFF